MTRVRIAKEKWMRALVVCGLLTMLLGCFAGCDKEKKNETVKPKEFEAVTEVKEGQKNIYYISKVLENAYWDVIAKCVKDEAQKQGCNLYFSGTNAETEWEAQQLLLEQAVEAGADAIIIAPDDSFKLSEPISKVHKQGIPVILIDTTITRENYDVCYMTDNLLAGQQAAKEMLRKLKEQGCDESEPLQIAIQVGYGSSQTIVERLAGFSQYWSDHSPAAWEILDDVKVNNGDADYAVVCANEFFDDYKNIKGVFGCNNGSTVGFAKAIKENERTDITIVGFDYSDEMAALIADDKYSASTMLQRQDEMGRCSVDTCLSLLNGEQVTEKFVDTGVVVVNEETINTDEIQAVIRLN